MRNDSDMDLPVALGCVLVGILVASIFWSAIVRNYTTANDKLIEANMAEYDHKTGEFKLIYPKKEDR